MGKLIVLGGGVVAAIVFAIMKARARQQAADRDASGACISCYSTDVTREGGRARCNACGFEVATPGGGCHRGPG